jgi:hypothetical protein
MANSVTWVVPLTITVSIGEPQIVVPQPDPSQIEFEKAKRRFQNQLTNQLDEIVEKTCER